MIKLVEILAELNPDIEKRADAWKEPSKDSDFPKRKNSDSDGTSKGVNKELFFTMDNSNKYITTNNKTHGLVSHAIKHNYSTPTESEQVKRQAKEFIKKNIDKFYLKRFGEDDYIKKGKEILGLKDVENLVFNDYNILNTLDHLNDRYMGSSQEGSKNLDPLEKQLLDIAIPMVIAYDNSRKSVEDTDAESKFISKEVEKEFVKNILPGQINQILGLIKNLPEILNDTDSEGRKGVYNQIYKQLEDKRKDFRDTLDSLFKSQKNTNLSDPETKEINDYTLLIQVLEHVVVNVVRDVIEEIQNSNKIQKDFIEFNWWKEVFLNQLSRVVNTVNKARKPRIDKDGNIKVNSKKSGLRNKFFSSNFKSNKGEVIKDLQDFRDSLSMGHNIFFPYEREGKKFTKALVLDPEDLSSKLVIYKGHPNNTNFDDKSVVSTVYNPSRDEIRKGHNYRSFSNLMKDIKDSDYVPEGIKRDLDKLLTDDDLYNNFRRGHLEDLGIDNDTINESHIKLLDLIK